MPCGEPSGLQKMNSVEGHEETPQDGGILRWEGHSPEGVLKFRLRFSTGYEEKPPEGGRERQRRRWALLQWVAVGGMLRRGWWK